MMKKQKLAIVANLVLGACIGAAFPQKSLAGPYGFKACSLASSRAHRQQGVEGKDAAQGVSGPAPCRPSSRRGGSRGGASRCGSSLVEILKNLEERKAPLSPSGPSSAQLFIFVSQSMPKGSIKALWEEAQKVGGRIVFRGLIGGSFRETEDYIRELGIVADIDPPRFEDYQITSVPTFVLARNGVFDKVSGHVSLRDALDQFRQEGELREDARRLYAALDASAKKQHSGTEQTH